MKKKSKNNYELLITNFFNLQDDVLESFKILRNLGYVDYQDFEKYDIYDYKSFMANNYDNYVIILEHPGESCVGIGWSKHLDFYPIIQFMLSFIDDEYLSDSPDFEIEEEDEEEDEEE
jgi:hypothetical protein